MIRDVSRSVTLVSEAKALMLEWPQLWGPPLPPLHSFRYSPPEMALLSTLTLKANRKLFLTPSLIHEHPVCPGAMLSSLHNRPSSLAAAAVVPSLQIKETEASDG